MKTLINSVKRSLILFQIRCIDKRYIRLNNDIAWYENELINNKQSASECRLTLLRQRSLLRQKFSQLESY